MAVSCRTISIGHILMVPVLGAAIGDRPRRSRRPSPWTIATPSTACIEPPSQAATAPRNRPPRIDPFTWGVARHPLRPFDHGDSKRIDRVPFLMKRKRLPWWMRFDGLVRPSNAAKNYLRMKNHTKHVFSYPSVRYLCTVLSKKGPTTR